jgi:cyclic-di-GMP-binding protein
MPSFDVVSKVQMHEVDNAVMQTSKEIATRYDFRDTNTSIERTEEGIVLRSSSEGRIEAALSVLQEKLVRRKVSLKAIDAQQVESAAGGSFRQLIKLNQGISTEKGKEVVKFLKGSGLKVQAAIQADQVRVSAPKKDTLQQAISAMRNNDFGIDLQFENYRD